MNKKEMNRKKRHFRIRKTVNGTLQRPRLSVKRTLANLHIQLVDDFNNNIILGLSTSSKEIKEKVSYGGNMKAAEVLAEILASKMKEKNLEKIAFDRGGFQYHGRVKVLAETLRKNGIDF